MLHRHQLVTLIRILRESGDDPDLLEQLEMELLYWDQGR